MTKYKIEKDFFGKYHVYKRYKFFFWKEVNVFYSLKDAEVSARERLRADNYKPEKWYY